MSSFAAHMIGILSQSSQSEFPSASGGDNVYDIDDNGVNYRVHEFLNDGTFSIQIGGEFEYLIVAGGGGGGNYRGAGGGAGGMDEGVIQLTSGTYPVVVGTGGQGAPSNTVKGDNGGNSSFAGITMIGGGAGGCSSAGDADPADQQGNDGGSGGGGCRQQPGGNGLSFYGHDGKDSDNFFGGGGGGAGSIESSTDFTRDGRISNISGSSITYATGGDANNDSTQPDGTNLGNGGQGNRNSQPSGQPGFSGVVIIRYRI